MNTRIVDIKNAHDDVNKTKYLLNKIFFVTEFRGANEASAKVYKQLSLDVPSGEYISLADLNKLFEKPVDEIIQSIESYGKYMKIKLPVAVEI